MNNLPHGSGIVIASIAGGAAMTCTARNPSADPVVVQDMTRLPHGSGILIALVISLLFWIAVSLSLIPQSAPPSGETHEEA